jgi:benzodiazapine receptor
MIILLPLLVGFSSFLLAGDLRQAPASSYQPPAKVFSIVWPILYLMMGVSGERIKRLTGSLPSIFFVQLFFNFTWSIVYTRVGPVPALVNITALLLAAMATFSSFGNVDRLSALLLLPYLVWLCFATFLNVDVVTKLGRP